MNTNLLLSEEPIKVLQNDLSKSDIIEKFFHDTNYMGNRSCKISDDFHLNSFDSLEYYDKNNNRFVPVSWKIFYDFLNNIHFFQEEKKDKDYCFKVLDWDFIKNIEVI